MGDASDVAGQPGERLTYDSCPAPTRRREGKLDPAALTALSAILGSAVGGSATMATAWFTQRTQGQREHVEAEIRKREQLYVEFITEGAKLTVAALDHEFKSSEQLSLLYSILNRIRLRCSEEVLTAADSAVTQILERYFRPNLSPDELRKTVLDRRDDPLKSFSEACRRELRMLERRA